MPRGAIYVDGFNLYHAIDDLGAPYLKWLNLWRLGELLARGHANPLVKAVFCTAYFPGSTGKKARHTSYVDALNLVGVETKLGHTTKEPMECRDDACGFRWDQNREKETDINMALSVYADAQANVYDVAFLVTADTDQAATLRAVRRDFPGKKLITVFPPGRPSSMHLRDLSDATIRMTENHVDLCVLPRVLMRAGERTVIRPFEYDPPVGWVHPDNRPA